MKIRFLKMIFIGAFFSANLWAQSVDCRIFYGAEKKTSGLSLVSRLKVGWENRPNWLRRKTPLISTDFDNSVGSEQHKALISSILKGEFSLFYDRVTRSGYSEGGPGIPTSWSTTYLVPKIEKYLNSMGFALVNPHQTRSTENSVEYSYSQFVPFGNRKLEMKVLLQYTGTSKLEDPVYEPAGNLGGNEFMGHSRMSAQSKAVAVRIVFKNDGKWEFMESWDPVTLKQYPPEIIAGKDYYYSYDTINKRKQLAVDLTRHSLKDFHSDGFERMDYSTVTPDVDLDIMRGGGYTDTEPISLNLDKRGHFLIFLSNLSSVMKMTDSQFARVRASIPHYRKIDERKGYLPENGQPYELARFGEKE